MAWLACAGYVVFVVCLTAALSDANQVVFGVPLMLRIGMGFGTAALPSDAAPSASAPIRR